jgi:hypothetical protein
MNRLQQTRRGKIGYTYKPQVNNNVATLNYSRSPYAVMSSQFDQNTRGMGSRPCERMHPQTGEGFTDIIKTLYDKGKKTGKFLYDSRADASARIQKIGDAYSGEIGTTLRNMIPDSDETARPGFVGERHVLLKLPNGKTGVGNYIGPGTNLIKRLERGDPPRTEVDKVAQLHDIRYGLAKTQADVRKADNIMINKVKQISRNRGDAPRNIAQASLMRAKVLGEDLGVLRKDAFSGDLSKNANIPAKDRALMMSKLNELAPQGYGSSRMHPQTVSGGSLQNMLPGDALKLKLLKQMARKRTKRQAGAGQSQSRDLGQNYKLMGNGINLPGGGKEPIQKFVMKKIIPSLMATVGIPKGTIATSSIAKMVGKALDMAKSGKLPQIVSHLTKTILPILTAAKLKHMASSRKSSANSRYKGMGIGDVLGKYKNMLLENLGKGLLGAFKWYINRGAEQRGINPIFKGSGINLPGGSFANFWKGFKKGFTMVFKPGAKILGAAATALGAPEIGVPLTALSELM